LAGATPSLAETASSDTPEKVGLAGSLEEVVITARRKEESLQTVPIAVTAIGAEELERTVLRSEDLQQVTPGLTIMPSSRGDTQPNYTIRGQRGDFNPTPLTDPAVALYFDDLALARSQGSNQALFDMQSVQVLKGPQGTLFGRNATGGAILFTPNAPTSDFDMYVKVGAGSYDFRDYEFMLNLPLSETVELRLGGKVTRRDGYLTNVLNGQRADDIDANSYRASLLFKPSENFSSTFVGSYYSGGGVGFAAKLEQIEPRGIPPALGPLVPVIAAALTQELVATDELGPYQFRGFNDLSTTDDVTTILNNSKWDIGAGQEHGGVTLKNILGYRETTNHEMNDFTGSGLDMFLINSHVGTDQFSEELQLQGKTSGLDYVAGVYYLRESGNEVVLGRQFGLLSTLIPPLAATFPIGVGYDDSFDTSSYAAFAHGSYDLSTLLTGLSVSAGLRWTRDDHEVTYHNIDSFGVNGAGGYVCTLTFKPLATPDPNECVVPGGKLSTSEPTYDVSLNYQVTPDVLVYLAHRKGYRSGNFNTAPIATQPSTWTFAPEFVRDAELGAKTQFAIAGMPARLNAALSNQWYDNIQREQGEQDPVTGAVVEETVNAAKATILAGEIEFTIQPTKRLELSVGFAYTDAKYQKWIAPYYPRPGVTETADIRDSKFSDVPKTQWNVSAIYTLPIPEAAGNLALSATAFGLSSMAAYDVNTKNCGADGLYLNCYNSEFQLPGYSLLNLRADWRNVAGLGFDLGAFVNNVTDKYYYNYSLDGLGLIGTNSVGIGAPRMWGVDVKVPFGASRR
jgi:iron complex outermembrane receptor protein